MRWNTKFINKQFTFDAILVKGLKPHQTSIIGKKPQPKTKKISSTIP